MNSPSSIAVPANPSPSKGEVEPKARVGVDAVFAHNRSKTAKACKLRVNAADAERKLWSKLRNAQMGQAFRRQHPIGDYIADFWCADAKLVVEVDGGQHGRAAQRAHDAKRAAFLAERGVACMRLWNNDVMANLSGVAEVIFGAVQRRVAELSTPTSPDGQSSTGALAYRPPALPLARGGDATHSAGIDVEPSITSPSKGEVGSKTRVGVDIGQPQESIQS